MQQELPPSERLIAAAGLVAEACLLAQKVRLQLAGGDVAQKSDHSPVTVGDYAIQAWIGHRLSSLEPGCRIVGEESATALGRAAPLLVQHLLEVFGHLHPQPTRDDVFAWLAAGTGEGPLPSRFWTIDPIDGTKGFLQHGQYAVCLALIEGGLPVLGVLGCPALPHDGLPRALDAPDLRGCLLMAERGAGAFSVPLGGDCRAARPIHAARVKTPLLRVCESRDQTHSRQGLLSEAAGHAGIELQPLRMDSQCKYALVARGDADVFLRLPANPDYIENIWDHAAGALIASEAGALVSDLDGRPLNFAGGSRITGNRGILVAAPDWQAQILSWLRALPAGQADS